MDEAESLCDNIAIMINGRFCCYGTTGHLKSAYGKGYVVVVQHVYGVEYIDQFINANMSYLEKVQTVMTAEKNQEGYPIYDTTYEMKSSIPIDSIGLYAIFDALCALRYQQNLVLNFTLTRGSLEQVFV